MSDKVQFLTDNVVMPSLDFVAVRQWIEKVAATFGKIVGELVYVFCDDSKILDVNVKFLGHDYYTDIITFDYCRGKLLRGDMYISLDTVTTNAVAVGSFYKDELLRVIIHGVLHLCGINDKGPGEREIMEKYENEALVLYNQIVISDEKRF